MGVLYPSLRALSRHHLIGDDDEFHEIHPAKARGQRDVGGVAPGGHQDAADARMIVAEVEGVAPCAGVEYGPHAENRQPLVPWRAANTPEAQTAVAAAVSRHTIGD